MFRLAIFVCLVRDGSLVRGGKILQPAGRTACDEATRRGGGEDGDFEAMEFSVPLRNMKYYLNGKIWIFPKMVGFPPKSSILIGLFHYSHHPYWG